MAVAAASAAAAVAQPGSPAAGSRQDDIWRDWRRQNAGELLDATLMVDGETGGLPRIDAADVERFVVCEDGDDSDE